jgi:hypothetical protein
MKSENIQLPSGIRPKLRPIPKWHSAPPPVEMRLRKLSPAERRDILEYGPLTHAIFKFESKNTDWVMFKIQNEEAMMFFNCKVANLK